MKLVWCELPCPRGLLQLGSSRTGHKHTCIKVMVIIFSSHDHKFDGEFMPTTKLMK